MFLTFTNNSKTGFEKGKKSYPRRKCNYFSHFQSPIKKSLYKMFLTFTNESKIGFENSTYRLKH